MQHVIQFFYNHVVLSASWFFLLTCVLYSIIIQYTFRMKLVNYSEVVRLINKDNAVVVDLRRKEDFCNGHIVGAVNLLLADIKINNFGELNKRKTQPIVLVDYTGMQAFKVIKILSKSGFKNIFVLKEGILGWNEENIPLIREKQ